jgi:hypothetical protein
MLAEVRAMREAIIIADQLPSALASEVVKNTGLKIVHRLTAQDDRETICAAMSASAMQTEELVTYETGEVLLFYEGLRKPFKARIRQWAYDGCEIGDRYLPMDDATLKDMFLQNDTRMQALMNQDCIHSVFALADAAAALCGEFADCDQAQAFFDGAEKIEERIRVAEIGRKDAPQLSSKIDRFQSRLKGSRLNLDMEWIAAICDEARQGLARVIERAEDILT